jgi:uncharacterized membrane protein
MKSTTSFFILKRTSLVLLFALYFGAGINHFWHPKGYWDLIPPYFPNHPLLNIIAGISEIFSAALLTISSTRKFGALLIIAILTAFIPAHIYLIQMKGCISERMCVPEWLAWIRLFPFQFILMWWAWKTYKWNS